MSTYLIVKPNITVISDLVYESELIQYRHNIKALQQSGVTFFRFSLSWFRIIPSGIGEFDEKALVFYNNILDICIENQIQPILSLHDTDLPISIELKGGWSNREILVSFEKYVDECVKIFKNKVTHWTIFSEPSVFTGANDFFESYRSNKNKTNTFTSILHHALLCQSIGFKKIKMSCQSAQVGCFFSYTYCSPSTYSIKDIKAAERKDAFLNRIFIEPSLGLGYPIKIIPFLKNIIKFSVKGDDNLIKVDFDFIGLQNCTYKIVRHDPFIPYFNAKMLDYDKLALQNKNLDFTNLHAIAKYIIIKYREYQIKSIFIDVNSKDEIAFKDLYPQESIKLYYNRNTVDRTSNL